MSYFTESSAGSGLCEALRLGIAAAGGANNQSFLRHDKTGLLQALFDDSNQPNLYQPNFRGRSLQSLIIPRIPRATPDDVGDGYVCNTGDTVNQTEQEVDPRNFMSSGYSFKIDHAQLQDYCESFSAIVTAAGSSVPAVLEQTGTGALSGTQLRHFNYTFQLLVSGINALRTKINENILSKVTTNAGINAATGSASPTTIGLLSTTDFSKREEALQTIFEHWARNSVNGMPLIVGSGLFSRFNTSFQYGCCNLNGLDWDAMRADSPYKFYRDDSIGAVTGLEDLFIVLSPAETQFVYTNQEILNDNPMVTNGNTTYSTVTDPMVPGLTYDLRIEYTPCDEDGNSKPSWNVHVESRYDVVMTPVFSYNPTDRLHGVNGVFLYEGVQV